MLSNLSKYDTFDTFVNNLLNKIIKEMRLNLLLFFCSVTCVATAQSDTIYLSNEKLIVNIKEVGEDAVKFTYPKEDIVNSIFKNSIHKIVFRSGRVSIFSESTNYKKVNGISDWELVSISQVESEVKGLYKLGDVSSKAKGGTTWTGMERIKERAFKKLKIQASMYGGNIIYMTQLNSAGAQQGYFTSKAAETSLSGIVYSNTLPEFKEFQKLTGDKKRFPTESKIVLFSNAKDASEANYKGFFELSNTVIDGKLLYMTGKINKGKELRYRVIRFDKNSFTLVHEDKSSVYNYILSFN